VVSVVGFAGKGLIELAACLYVRVCNLGFCITASDSTLIFKVNDRVGVCDEKNESQVLVRGGCGRGFVYVSEEQEVCLWVSNVSMIFLCEN